MRAPTVLAIALCALSLVAPWLVAGCARSHEIAGDGGPARDGGPSDPRGGTATCVPGTMVQVGCAAGCGIGSCTGDPVLVVCEGSASVSACLGGSGTLAQVDDSACGSLCPELSVACPSSGRLTIAHRPFGSAPYTCDWAVR